MKLFINTQGLLTFIDNDGKILFLPYANYDIFMSYDNSSISIRDKSTNKYLFNSVRIVDIEKENGSKYIDHNEFLTMISNYLKPPAGGGGGGSITNYALETTQQLVLGKLNNISNSLDYIYNNTEVIKSLIIDIRDEMYAEMKLEYTRHTTSGSISNFYSATIITSNAYAGTINGTTAQPNSVYTFSSSKGVFNTVNYTITSGEIQIIKVVKV